MSEYLAEHPRLLTDPPTRVAFLYLGRRGALGRFVLELTAAATEFERVETTIAVSRANACTPKLMGITDRVLALDTFRRATPFAIVSSFLTVRGHLLNRLERERPSAVVTLMPHIWTPLLAPAIKSLGIRYVTVIHDAVSHPGDPTGMVTPWLVREARLADLVVTLSRTVADRLISARKAPPDRVLPLFHPDLTFGTPPFARTRQPGRPLRLLFFGRILPYKGLPLLIDAVEMLRSEGIIVELGVAGLGKIGADWRRLKALGAEVTNRWIEDDEIGPLLARYDAIALSHIEASQSGVAAAAFGNCMPVVGMPVGGIAEQVIDGRTGVMAHRANARSFADAVHRLAVDLPLYQRISRHLKETTLDRSMGRFVDELVAETITLDRPARRAPA
jgi:glycosyltransferase involved in cell wall biosynthesis